uniref:uncharacterized protein LOC123462756 n=1 Tax=Jaculus jaculus TaxID=51337 RepID=UPI001E1B0BF9|nr:uncharacterized protein LOC123462756 [Jaculus jaculus]
MRALDYRLETFDEEKEWIYRLTGFLCSFLAWGFCLTVTTSKFWRLWKFENPAVQLVYFGLWEAYYYQLANVSGSLTKSRMYSPINSSWVIPIEMEYSQGLMLMANFMMLVVLIFSSVAIMVSWIDAPFPEYMELCYNASILFLVLSNICVMIAVSWNEIMESYGQSSFDFPPYFPVKRDALLKKYSTHVFPGGILVCTLSTFAIIMYRCEIKVMKSQWIKVPMYPKLFAPQKE